MTAARPAGALRFTFGDDLGRPAQERRAAAERAGVAEREAVLAAEQAGYARGLAAGRQEAAASGQARLTEAAERLANGAAVAFCEIDRRAEEIERDALVFFDVLARKLAGRALAAEPLAAVADAAAEAFRHLRGVPHLAVRVDEALVDDVEGLCRRMARERGFEGRIIVMGEPDLSPGDVRLDWADGGVTGGRHLIEDAAGSVIARTFDTFQARQASRDPT